MTYEEFKKLPLQEKVLFYGRRYRLSYFCEDSCYIGCLKGNQGHIINLTMEGLPFLSVGWITEKIVKSKNPQEEIAELQDKLSRRNLLAKDLRKKIEKLENKLRIINNLLVEKEPEYAVKESLELILNR